MKKALHFLQRLENMHVRRQIFFYFLLEGKNQFFIQAVNVSAVQEMIELIRQELHLIKGRTLGNGDYRIGHIALVGHHQQDGSVVC